MLASSRLASQARQVENDEAPVAGHGAPGFFVQAGSNSFLLVRSGSDLRADGLDASQRRTSATSQPRMLGLNQMPVGNLDRR